VLGLILLILVGVAFAINILGVILISVVGVLQFFKYTFHKGDGFVGTCLKIRLNILLYGLLSASLCAKLILALFYMITLRVDWRTVAFGDFEKVTDALIISYGAIVILVIGIHGMLVIFMFNRREFLSCLRACCTLKLVPKGKPEIDDSGYDHADSTNLDVSTHRGINRGESEYHLLAIE
jgi:hypothetical protein